MQTARFLNSPFARPRSSSPRFADTLDEDGLDDNNNNEKMEEDEKEKEI